MILYLLGCKCLLTDSQHTRRNSTTTFLDEIGITTEGVFCNGVIGDTPEWGLDGSARRTY